MSGIASKFGFDHAIPQQLVQPAGGQAGGCKADICADPLICLLAAGEYPSLRQSASVDVVSRTRSFRKLNRRARQARRYHQGRQRSGTPGTDRGGLDIPLSRKDQLHNQRKTGRPSEVGLRDCVERASKAVHSLPTTDKCRKGKNGCCDGHRPRNGGLHMGDRARSSAPRQALKPAFCTPS